MLLSRPHSQYLAAPNICLITSYPLTAPAVIPLMIYFCKKMYTITTGTTTSVTAAAINP